jgi:hypothetical protein
MKISYFDQNGTKLDSPLPNPFVRDSTGVSENNKQWATLNPLIWME